MYKQSQLAKLNFIAAACLLLTAFSCFAGATKGPGEEPSRKMLKVVVQREGDVSRFFVKNLEQAEMTVTFDMDLLNLKGSTNFPFTATYPGNQTTAAFTLSPIEPDQKWDYSYTSYYTVGSCDAVHDDRYIYSLPYAPGTAFKVSQGHNGSYSHTGAEQYAIDWRMPVGTPVHAARSGVVVKVKDDSSKGGGDRKYENAANYILIRHDDGTVANYAHLQKNGSKVTVGQTVETGELIALSGSTGFSTGPHLHFAVFKTRDGRQRESIPVRFRTAETASASLVEGKTYKSFPSTTGTKALAATTPGESSKPVAIGSPAQGTPTH
jgi:murein DD-endopeptidase MepM/ murein hydrolase activator NlpD